MAFFQYVLLSSLQLWRDLIDSLVSHSLWLRALLGLPEKETIYLDMPEEQLVGSLDKTRLAFALLQFVLKGQTCLLL